jgi:hypothetical protein
MADQISPVSETVDLIEDLTWVRQRVRNCRGAIESNQVEDKDVRGSLLRITERLDDIIGRHRGHAQCPPDREQIAALLYMTRFPHLTWISAGLTETAFAYKQADAILALSQSSTDCDGK